MTTKKTEDRLEMSIDLDSDDLNDNSMVDLQFDPDFKESTSLKQEDKAQQDEDNDDLTFDFNDLDIEEELVDEDPPEKQETPKKQKEEASAKDSEGDTSSKDTETRGDKRIRQLVAEKKQAEAEKKQAEAVAAALAKRLQETLVTNQETSTRQVDTETSLWESQVDKAESALAEALEAADAKKIAKAQKELNDAQFNFKIASAQKANRTKDSGPTPEDIVKDAITKAVTDNPVRVEESQQAQGNPNAVDWVKKNAFILGRRDIEQTATQVFLALQSEGHDINEPETYRELEDRLSILHPELDRWFAKSADKSPAPAAQQTKKTTQAAPPSAGATQTVSTKAYQVRDGKIVVNPTSADKEMANSLGLSLKDYMKEKIRYEANVKKGSKQTSIFD